MSKGKKKRAKKRLKKQLEHEKEIAERNKPKSVSKLFFVDKLGIVSQSLRRKLAKQRVSDLCGVSVETLKKKERQSSLIKRNPTPKTTRRRRVKKKVTSTPQSESDGPPKKKQHILDIWGESAPTGRIATVSNNFKIEVEDIKSPVFKHNKKAADYGILRDGTQVCHPGVSFNPSKEDHQNAVKTAFVQHTAEMKEANTVNNAFKKIREYAAKQTWRQKRENVEDEKMSEESEGEENKRLTKIVKRKVKAEDRKTKVQKNREKRRKDAEVAVRRKKRAKRLLDQVDKVGDILDELKDKETKQELKRQKLEKEKEAYKPPRLGKLRYTPEVENVQPSSEHTPVIRKIKPNQDLFKGMQKNIERRNIMEPRKRARAPRRKFKQKFYTRKNFKKTYTRKSFKKT